MIWGMLRTMRKVKYPMHECRGFYAVPPTECTRKGLRGPLPGPFVRCSLNGRLVGSVRLSDWHTERLVRYCFYPRERFTVERPNSILLSVCIGEICPGAIARLMVLRLPKRTGIL